MKELIILKMGEVVLKGLNRDNFENTLLKNARRRLEDLGEFKVYRSQSTAYCEPLTDDCDMDEAFARLCKVFGFVALARCAVVEKDMAKILEAAGDYLAPQLGAARTFKVNAKRSDKGFPKKSPEICADVGEYLLEKFPHLKVDVIEPQVTVTVEIRDFGAYIHADAVKGAGGLPVGTSKKALLLLSGGIDSPVAGHMTAKRGVFLSAVYFETPPYTGAVAKEKVVS
ncbi:MAG: tRNA 4-thiouridine(8) synthase ThiI, partial [Clostridia bacterium]|nr:tRNA 4-thiouridine(8) synthase ThiI [Clostridia bacterium]